MTITVIDRNDKVKVINTNKCSIEKSHFGLALIYTSIDNPNSGRIFLAHVKNIQITA